DGALAARDHVHGLSGLAQPDRGRGARSDPARRSSRSARPRRRAPDPHPPHLIGGAPVSSFTVTAAGQKVQLDGTGAAAAQYTVTTTSPDELSGRLLATPQDPAKAEWFSIDGEATREFAAAAAEQVRLKIKVPAGTPPATYSVRLDAVSEVN